MADNVNAFDGEQFYTDWTTRYFGEEAGKHALHSMKKLHEAQFSRVGYVQHLWEIREAISYLSNAPLERPGKVPIPYDYRRVENDFEHVAKRILILKDALKEAQEGERVLGTAHIFYHDYILYPVKIYVDLLEFERVLHQMGKDKKQFEDSGDKAYLQKAIDGLDAARQTLEVIHQGCVSGDKNPTWEGWYYPENRRPNNGFPTMEMLNVVEENLKRIKN